MASGQDSSGTTLMDLITSDPSAASGAGASSQQQSSSGGGGGGVGSLLGKPAASAADRKSKKGTLAQIQNETISAAKALNPVKVLPQRNRKKKARPRSPPSRHFLPSRSQSHSVDSASPAARLVRSVGAEHPRARRDV
jgi:hypothetical protein